jgi:hypothetical protein
MGGVIMHEKYRIVCHFTPLSSPQVDTSWQAGDHEGARRYSRIALLLNVVSIVGGIVLTAGILYWRINLLYS